MISLKNHKRSNRNHLHQLLAAVVFALVMPIAIFVAPAAAATSGSSGAKAKCAILDEGVVTCPGYLGKLASGTCYYEDPGSPAFGSKDGWQKGDCGSPIFKSGELAQVQPSEDPALVQCQKSNCDLIKKYIDPLINVLSAGVGLAVTISIVVGGIQYSTSGGDPQKSAAAKSRISKSVMALIFFFLLYAFLSWLLPGGIPKSG